MATQSLTVRTILEKLDDVGESPSKDFDESLVLSGFEAGVFGQRLKLAPAASDQPLVIPTNALYVLLFSHDYSFKIRLAAGETLLTGLRSFGFTAYDTTVSSGIGTVYLTGNGSNAAHIEIWYAEKP